MMPAIRALWALVGVVHTLVTMQTYGTPWYKLTGFLHNVPTFACLDLGESEEKCAVQLRGTLKWQGKEIMKTSVAAEYPVTIGMNYAIAYKAAELLRLRSKHGVMPHPSKSEDSGVMDSTCPWEQWPGTPRDLNYLECPDLKFPFVPQGLGAPTGLSALEHCRWAQKQDHPDAIRLQDTVVDDDVREAMEFERCHSSDEIDEFRQSIMVAKLDGRRQKYENCTR